MGSHNVSAEQRHIIFITGQDSTKVVPYGYAKAFPIEDIDYTDLGSQIELGSNKTFRRPEYPSFTTYNLKYNPDVKFAEGINELNEKLYILRESQKPTEIKLVTLVNVVRSGKGETGADTWESVKEQVLPEATVHLVAGYSNVYKVIADTSTLGIGDKATDKKPINFRDGTAK